ncbi:MAG: tripartite tricarboxylate transporter substrate binding protein [Burkholderiales bacterium]|nr:tripartite tricarboxylate transporter substrate binding protein [Burkholderiales bacterium]
MPHAALPSLPPRSRTHAEDARAAGTARSRVASGARPLILAAVLVAAADPLAAAEDAAGYPAKPIRFIVPFLPGGATDVVTRVVAQRLNEHYRRQVAVVDNRGGAGGIVGSELAARAAPDGYTVVMGTTGTHAINASLYAKLPYDPVRDFAPVTPAALLPNLLVTHPSVPARTVKELIALARSRPRELSYASSGNFLYLSGALFTSMAGVDMLHVPFKGGAQAMPAVIAGEVALSFATLVSALPHAAAGRLRGIAVTSASRFPTARNYPTVAESGLPGYEAVAWYGVFAPAGTARGRVQRLNADIVRIVQSPEVRELFLKQGATSYASASEEFSAVVRRDIAKWAKVVAAAGAKPG